MSPGELFGAMVRETERDHGGCALRLGQLAIEGEVWVEPNARERPITDISADLWVRMANGDPRQVNVSRP